MSDSIAKINMNIHTKTIIPNIKMEAVGSSSAINSYDHLTGKPQINGVTLIGNKSLAELHIVALDTTENWNADPEFIPEFGQVCVYTDYYENDRPAIKIGDGNAYLIDLPFVSEQLSNDIIQTVNDHIANINIHITNEERDFWNAKLNYEINDEELIFNRL